MPDPMTGSLPPSARISAALPTADRPSVRWTGLTGAATALAVAQAAVAAPGPVLLVTTDAATAARLEEELRFFCAGAVPVCGFPGYETLPYDQFSPHPDIISQRLGTLA
jgi:transcription-repair coupling factor (superfamily II helicase)